MKYITEGERGWELTAYIEYVRGQQHAFPRGAGDFALQPWHYDIKHHQCPHDSWLEEVSVREITKEQVSKREVHIVARFLGAYHDGHFEFIYDEVLEHFHNELGYPAAAK
jgi:hypothetical protein